MQVGRRHRLEMKSSHPGLVVGTIACRAQVNVWNHTVVDALFTNGVMSQRPASKAIASGVSCPLRRAALI